MLLPTRPSEIAMSETARTSKQSCIGVIAPSRFRIARS
jgi:hypothetical protein